MNYLVTDTCQVRGLNEIYLKYFGYREDGCFVEVGSADGISWSNTYGLYYANWQGFMYEPDKRAYEKCVTNLKNFPKVKVYNVAIGSRIGYAKLYEGSLGGSTINDDYLKAIQLGNGWNPSGNEYYVSMITLNQALIIEKLFPGQVDVLSIDTEGNEPDVLEGFDITFWKPKMVIIEAHEYYPGVDRPKTALQINEYFDKYKYLKIYSDEVNNIYVHRKLGM